MSGVKLKLKKDDIVEIMAGREKGKKGKILALFPNEGRLTVEKLNMLKRHTKPSAQNKQGGIVEKEAPVHLSNLAIEDPKDAQPTRVGFKTLEDGRKVRFAKRSGEVIDL